MPDRKLYDLCSRITKERDPEKLTATIDELIKLLNEEQAAIKAKIRANLSTGMTAPE
jgi:hypothetical protein